MTEVRLKLWYHVESAFESERKSLFAEYRFDSLSAAVEFARQACDIFLINSHDYGKVSVSSVHLGTEDITHMVKGIEDLLIGSSEN